MATTALAQSLFDTGNVATYTCASFTPANGDHLSAFVTISTEASSDWVVTDSLGGTWTKIRRDLRGGSASFMELWVRNSAVSGAAMTVTFSHATPVAAGCCMVILKTTGMSNFGTASVRQSGGQSNVASGGTPAVTFAGACLTGNVVLAANNVLANPATMTPPSGFSEDIDSGFATPATGLEVAHANSGITATTITWGSAQAGGGYCSIAAELDTSGGVTTVTAAATIAETHGYGKGVASVTTSGIAQGRAGGKGTALASVITSGQAQGRARGRATGVGQAFAVVAGQAVGRARGRGTLAFSIQGAVTTFAQGHGRARGRATAVTSYLAIGVAQGRARTRGTSVAVVVTSAQGVGRAKAFSQALGDKLITGIQGQAVGWSHGRSTAVASRIVSATAAGWAHGRASALGTATSAGVGSGRGRGRAMAVGSTISLGQAQGRSRARAQAVATLIAGINQSAPAIGRARARATAVAQPFTHSGIAQGRARARGTAVWTVPGFVTAIGHGRARARGMAVAVVTTQAQAVGRARGFVRAIGTKVVPVITGKAFGFGKGRARIIVAPNLHLGRAFGRAHTTSLSVGRVLPQEAPWQQEFERHTGGVVGVSPAGRELVSSPTANATPHSGIATVRSGSGAAVRNATPNTSTMQPQTEGAS